jgi:hypothetical protein
MKILRSNTTENSIYIERFSFKKLKWVYFYKISNTLEPLTESRVAELINRIIKGNYILWEKR